MSLASLRFEGDDDLPVVAASAANNNNDHKPTVDSSSLSEASFAPQGSVNSRSRSNSASTDPSSDVFQDEDDDESKGGMMVANMTKTDTARVRQSKMIVYISLCLAATAIGVATYLFLSSHETSKFKSEFSEYAVEVASVAESNAHNVFGQMHSLSTTLTSYAIQQHDDDVLWWPFVTVPHFDLRAATEAEELGADLILFAPLLLDKNEKRNWETYSVKMQGWIQEDLDLRKDPHNPGRIPEKLHGWPPAHEDDATSSAKDVLWLLPVWQLGPVPTNASVVNLDLGTHLTFQRMVDHVLEIKHVLLSEPLLDLSYLHALAYGENYYQDDGHPHSFVLQPVFDDFFSTSKIVGFLVGSESWSKFFTNVLPTGTNGMVVDVKETCGAEFTYIVNGHEAEYIGQGDLHDPAYDSLKYTTEFAREARYDGANDDDIHHHHCGEYTLTIYASATFEAPYHSYAPALFTAIVVLVFLTTIAVFSLYDCMVKRRQDLVLTTAERTSNIVASLFPSNVRDRILEEAQEQAELEDKKPMKKKAAGYYDLTTTTTTNNPHSGFFTAKTQLRDFLSSAAAPDDASTSRGAGAGGPVIDTIYKTKPIADFFPAATIMFADLVGFTAWSSMREPAQVFTLLETFFAAFDECAKRRSVFKVETVGDCYVAVAGLPTRRPDHAVCMARFARDCLYKLLSLTSRLEVQLGPDTAELGLRIGLHSGPVTAGVLRGERSRFQLFGDTVNTTARMESTGQKNQIHISSETAELIRKAGKEHWLRKREEKVVAKGKGELVTYWLNLKGDSANSATTGSSTERGSDDTSSVGGGGRSSLMVVPSSAECYNNSSRSLSAAAAALPEPSDRSAKIKARSKSQPKQVADPAKQVNEKQNRLVDWIKDVLASFLKEIVARREASGVIPESTGSLRSLELESQQRNDNMVLDEVKVIITLPEFDPKAAARQRPVSEVTLPSNVIEQLRDYIHCIADLYRDNPFHNFEHASHITMSVVKLLSRIVAPELDDAEALTDDNQVASKLHDHTYGITSDPLTKFAAVFSALIHDADHPGVPNTTLVKEQVPIATVYKNKSVAEQNSVDLAWDLLMDDRFAALRCAIYCTRAEFTRFRQLVVNAVMATDIMDKDLGALRKERWDQAFSGQPQDDVDRAINRKATIVIEHLIQASDVAHTMQHWHIYRKWNARLFRELYNSYRAGRAESNPADFWYKGEIGFFDFYIIPLAKKLENCGVFGVSSHEYLNYATQNRQEWELKGDTIVAELLETARTEYDAGMPPLRNDSIMGSLPPASPAASAQPKSGNLLVSDDDDDDARRDSIASSDAMTAESERLVV